ncbi:MAG TPA: TetR/AcrR family transcriptional regulator [Myxococcota bacterium]|nr:TetR/AcrR family transcriptional regulator [Myxococcota bacterium]
MEGGGIETRGGRGRARRGAAARGASRANAPRARAARLSPEERRAQLLGVALRVFARRGLGEARHAEIAQEAGVSVPTVFVYFPTRAELVSAVLDEVADFLIAMAERIHDTRAPVPRVILAHAEAFAHSIDTHPAHARVWLDWSTAIREEVWPRYLAFQEKIVAIVEATLERGLRDGTVSVDVDPEDDARLIVGAAHMVAQMKLLQAAPERVARFVRTLVRATVGSVGDEDGREGGMAGRGARRRPDRRPTRRRQR